MLDSFFKQSSSLASLLSHNPDRLTEDSLGLLLHHPGQITVDLGERRSPHATTERSHLVELIQQHELADAIEATGLHGENALFLIQAVQCWLCGGTESTIVPAIADSLNPSIRCANCDCFFGIAEGGSND